MGEGHIIYIAEGGPRDTSIRLQFKAATFFGYYSLKITLRAILIAVKCKSK